jgi:hypothetical protein
MQPFWWEYVAAARKLRNAPPSEIRNEIESLKHLTDEERRTAIERITREAELSLPRTVIDWDDAREMAEHGIRFGGHTKSHPILSKLPSDALRAEISGCRDAIRENLGSEPSSFAYPVGRSFAVSDAAVQAVREAGFSFAVTTEYGRNPVASLNAFRLKRIGIGLEDSFARFKAKFLAPRFFGGAP